MDKFIKLNESGITLYEKEHIYTDGVKEYQGITGVLSRQLFPDKYSSVPDSVLKSAAEYGSNVHATIELCDSLGDYDNPDKNYIAYRKLMNDNNLHRLRNEYIVTDKEYYASAIDLVATDENGDIALIDIKTTSKLDEESVSWQLSIYRYLFYILNPHLKGSIKSFYALWLPKEQYGSPQLVRVYPKSESEVIDLLECDKNGDKFVVNCDNNELVLPNDAIDNVIEIVRNLEIAKEKEKELKSRLLELMSESSVKSFKNDRILLTRVVPKDEDSYTLDTAKLKKEMPEIYNQFLKKKAKQQESLRIKIY